jgi:hypothetical protein
MSDTLKEYWESHLDPELENKFLEIKDRLDLTGKKTKDGGLTKETSIIRDIADDYRILAEQLKCDLYNTRKKVKSYEDNEDFYRECENLLSIKELRKSNNLPIGDENFAYEFASKGLMNYKYGSQTSYIMAAEMQRRVGGHIARYLEAGTYRRILSICKTKERQKVDLKSFIDEEEKSTFDLSRIAGKIRKFPKSLQRKFISKYKKNSDPKKNIRVTIQSLKLELVDAYIINSFKDYISRREIRDNFYFRNDFIADPISMNESDYKQDNFRLVLYQTETNIFKAPTGSTNPFECMEVEVADVLKYKTDLAKKYRHLLLAPLVDCYGNRTFIAFSDERPYLQSRSKDTKVTNWRAYYENDCWIQSSSNMENLMLWRRKARLNKKKNKVIREN